MENKFRFSEARLKALQPPKKERASYYDTDVKELELRVTPTGVKSFYVYRWSSALQKPVRAFLGKWPSCSVNQARKEAHTLIRDIIDGKDPSAKKRLVRDELTLGTALENYFTTLRLAERKPATFTLYHYLTERFLKDWKARKLASITTEQVLSLRARARDKDGTRAVKRDKTRSEKSDRTVTANRLIRVLSQTYNHAIRGGWNGKNPCLLVKPFPERRVTRRLEEDEIGSFLETCNQIRAAGDWTVDYLLMCLYTGARRRNVAAARWSDIGLEFGVWNIPDTKNNLGQKVYLSTPLKTLLAERREVFGNNPYVFPGPSKSGHLEEPRKILHKVLKEAGIDPTDFTIHTLKHSLISFSYAAGINPLVVTRMGGHRLPGITAQVYGHASEQQVKEGYERAAAYMNELYKNYLKEKEKKAQKGKALEGGKR